MCGHRRSVPVGKENEEKETVVHPMGCRQVSVHVDFSFSEEEAFLTEQALRGKRSTRDSDRPAPPHQAMGAPWRRRPYFHSGKESDIKDGHRSQVTITGQCLMGTQGHGDGINFM